MVLENNRTLSDYPKRVLLGLPGLEAQPKPFPEGTANWEPQSSLTSLGAKQNWIPPSIWVPTDQSVCCSVMLTLCDPMYCSLPGSSVHEILRARILEWVARPFSRGSFPPRDQTWVSCIANRFFTSLSHQGRPNRPEG